MEVISENRTTAICGPKVRLPQEEILCRVVQQTSDRQHVREAARADAPGDSDGIVDEAPGEVVNATSLDGPLGGALHDPEASR